jgi:DNA (cytosine-5)-methyltransferase 1
MFFVQVFLVKPFSIAGLKKGFDDTRGTLFFNIKEIVRTKIEQNGNGINGDRRAPGLLILENVKGFKNHDKGNTYRVVEKTLRSLGYEVKSEVLNSKHFGIPQNRERIFIVAWLNDKYNKNVEDVRIPLGLTNDGQPIFEKSLLADKVALTSVGDILLSQDDLDKLEQKAKKTYTISEKLWQGHKRRRLEHKLKGNGFGYSMFDSESRYTSTISARYYKDGSEILINQKNTEYRLNRPRKLHPIEAARLQGFPIDSWYEIPVSDVQAYKQFGNSVTVPVVKTLVTEIIRQLFYA